MQWKIFLARCFYDFSKDINTPIFHGRMRVLKHTPKEALQPFKWRSLPRELLLWSLNLLSKAISLRPFAFHVTEGRGWGALNVIRLKQSSSGDLEMDFQKGLIHSVSMV